MDMSSLFIANEIPDRAPVNLIADEVETAVLFSKMIKIVKREACLKRLTGKDIDLICNTHYHFLQIYIEKGLSLPMTRPQTSPAANASILAHIEHCPGCSRYTANTAKIRFIITRNSWLFKGLAWIALPCAPLDSSSSTWECRCVE